MKEGERGRGRIERGRMRERERGEGRGIKVARRWRDEGREEGREGVGDIPRTLLVGAHSRY